MESVQKVRKLLIRQLWTSLGRHRDRSLTSGGKKISFLARQKVFMIRRSKHIDLISVGQDQRQIFCQLSSLNISVLIIALLNLSVPRQNYKNTAGKSAGLKAAVLSLSPFVGICLFYSAVTHFKQPAVSTPPTTHVLSNVLKTMNRNTA